MVKLLDVYKPLKKQRLQDKGLMMVFEYMDGGDMSDFMKKRNYRERGMPIDQVIDFTEQIFHAVNHIHELGYLHRDLKPANILIGKEDSRTINGDPSTGRAVKVADFGLSRQVSFPLKPLTKEIQTLHYRAPEIMLDNLEYSYSVDMWSMGVMIYYMLTGKDMFYAHSEIEYLIEVIKRKGTPNSVETNYYKKFTTLLKIGPLLPDFKSSALRKAEGNLTTSTIDDSF